MAVKSNNLQHQERAHVLRQLRLESSLTQQELADRLDISREKVVAVENYHLKSMKALELDTIKLWWELCRPKAKSATLKNFTIQMKRELNI